MSSLKALYYFFCSEFPKKNTLKILNMTTDEAIAEMKSDTEQTMKLKWLYRVDSQCELNSWPDSSVG